MLDKNSKPYGCLAFNPRYKDVKDGKGCKSNRDNLKDRNMKEENYINQQMKTHLNIEWSKTTITSAVLELFHLNI